MQTLKMLEESETIYCDICAQNGKTSKIKVYQINFEEATKICENEKCTYPFGLRTTTAGAIINRKYTDIANLPRKKDHNPHQQSSVKKRAVTTPSSVVNSPMVGVKPVKFTTINKILAPYVPGKSSVLERKSGNQSQSAKNVNGAPTTPESMDIAEQKSSNIINDSSQDDLTSNCLKDEKIFKSLNLGDQLIYPQWQNKDALCWLDVVMCLFVHSKTFERFVDVEKDLCPSVLVTLIKAYKQAMYLFNSSNSSQKNIVTSKQVGCEEKMENMSKKCSIEQMDVDQPCPMGVKVSVCKEVVGDFKRLSVDEDRVKTGAGFQVIDSDFLSVVAAHGDKRYAKGLEILQNVRESTWKSIQPKLRCRKGQNDSPVFAIPLLLKDNKRIERLFNMSYSFTLKCKHCGHTKTDHYDKVLPTFPNTSRNFQMSAPSFMRPCFHCDKPNQQRVMVYEKLSEIVMLYFVEGLPHNSFEKLGFSFHGNWYAVTGLIQYRNDPDHFVAWIRDPNKNLWMECDDLKSPVTSYSELQPDIPASQIHVVMWEIQKCDTLSKPSTTSQKIPNGSTKITPMVKCGTDAKNASAVKSKTESCVVQSNVSMDKVRNGVVETVNTCERKTNLVGNNIFFTLTSSGQLVPVTSPGGLTSLGQLVPVVSHGPSSSGNLIPVMSQGQCVNSPICPSSVVPYQYVNNSVKVQLAQNVKPLSTNSTKLVTPNPHQMEVESAAKSVVMVKDGVDVLKSSLAAQNLAVIPVFNPQAKAANRKVVKDSLLSKTKNNVSFLRSIKRTRAKADIPSRNTDLNKHIESEINIRSGLSTKTSQLKTCASESSFFNKMSISNLHSANVSSGFCVKGKVFEGYKSKGTEDSLSSRASSPMSVSSSSRCSSPALSTSSDGVVIQKRKTEVSVKISRPKRRKSEAMDSLAKNTPDDDSSCGIDDSGVSDLNSECQVLQGLYNALNINLPEKSLPPSTSVSSGLSDALPKDDLPEVLELTQFIDNDNCTTNIDEFLAQL